MKYISIDTETTGLDANRDMLLELGLVVADTEKPFQLTADNSLRIVFCRKNITGSIYAIDLNNKLLKEILEINTQYFPVKKDESRATKLFHQENNTVYINLDKGEYYLEEILEKTINNFLIQNGIEGEERLNIAGENFSNCDKYFLNTIVGLKSTITNRMRHRVLDIGSMYLQAEDKNLPSLKTCLERAGIIEEVPHSAIKDAVLVIKCVEAKLAN